MSQLPGPQSTRAAALAAGALAGMLAAAPGAAATAPQVSDAAERAAISAWRARRIDSLTSDTGWLTLAGLFWLKPGDNTFGRAASNALILDNAALAGTAGSFVLSGDTVRFVARPGGGVTHDGRPVTTLDLTSDAHGEPTVLASGALRFFVIERAGNLGVRVRDLNNPHRLNFQGLSYFPVSSAWVLEARFEPLAGAPHQDHEYPWHGRRRRVPRCGGVRPGWPGVAPRCRARGARRHGTVHHVRRCHQRP
jgi:hypothetical protein